MNRSWGSWALLVTFAGAGAVACSTPGTTGTDSGTVRPGEDGGPGNDAYVPPGTDGGSPPAGWHAITGTDSQERITGVYCTSTSACVVDTEADTADNSHLYATDNTHVTSTLILGDDALASQIHLVGTPGFLGFTRVGDRLIAHLEPGCDGFVSATGDFTQASSWTVQLVGGISGDPDGFALNAQYGWGHGATEWTQFRNGLVYTSTDMPGPTATWVESWSPQAVPPVPAGIDTMHASDPTICSSDPGFSEGTIPTQAAYVAADGAIILSPANGLNQDTDDVTGVCISTDGGHMFRLAPLPVASQDILGPTAQTCTSHDHCIVGGGTSFVDDSTYVYVSNDASMGAASHWTAATIPTVVSGSTFPQYIFFAPDGMHGWIGGNQDGLGFLWQTTDGGMSWTDITGQIRSLSTSRLWAGFAIDATHVVVGGEDGTLLANF